jgi:hypothetical protein
MEKTVKELEGKLQKQETLIVHIVAENIELKKRNLGFR